jgi:hypothetical protein
MRPIVATCYHVERRGLGHKHASQFLPGIKNPTVKNPKSKKKTWEIQIVVLEVPTRESTGTSRRNLEGEMSSVPLHYAIRNTSTEYVTSGTGERARVVYDCLLPYCHQLLCSSRPPLPPLCSGSV